MQPAKRTHIKDKSQAGFSLVETVAAMGILALAAVPLMQLTTQAVGNTAKLESRFLARTVAENVMARSLAEPLQLEAGVEIGSELQMARTYNWTRLTSPPDATGLQSIEVSVVESDDSQVLARLLSLKAAPLVLPKTTDTTQPPNDGGTQG